MVRSISHAKLCRLVRQARLAQMSCATVEIQLAWNQAPWNATTSNVGGNWGCVGEADPWSTARTSRGSSLDTQPDESITYTCALASAIGASAGSLVGNVRLQPCPILSSMIKCPVWPKTSLARRQPCSAAIPSPWMVSRSPGRPGRHIKAAEQWGKVWLAAVEQGVLLPHKQERKGKKR